VADLNIEEMMFDISFAGYGSLYFKRVFLVSYEGGSICSGLANSDVYCIGPIADDRFWLG
jgi:hypothetical protein